MKILYIDTTSNYLYAAIYSLGKITAEIKLKMDKDLSVFALKEISLLFDKSNIKPNDIDKIIVSNGPGSFTGIRVGVTIAKTFAWGLKKEISVISSLEAMAISTKKDTTFRVPIIDARRGYVFAGIYDQDNNESFKSQYIELTKLKSILLALPGEYSIITNDNIDFDEKEEYDPQFIKIIEKYMDRESVNPHGVNPNYLKMTEAEEKKMEDNII
ncbi:MAG: tRNA (adenosine(37)-N6)-threonylcarbamoyltransferase complex dimerization subunit type 1 TsaB [Bacilli bacterium]|nr:tRNA (adenosine(37)-N6)-threonylcarbamoyltransferase complex dimerization subunit type 1 TsaB [Bacilli bacterium]